MKKVLVVEDEYAIRELITFNLKLAGYDVDEAQSAEIALSMYDKDRTKYDVMLLDIMLPGMSGLDFCELIRKDNTEVGIIMLTAKAQEKDKINGLETGADDYVTKPFSISELIARVDAVHRRIYARKNDSSNQKEYRHGPFVLNTGSRILMKAGKKIELTQVEYQIMELFFDNIGVALGRETILKSVWGKTYYGEIKIVDVNIRRLRMKIEDNPSNPIYIETVWGFGYRFSV